MRAIISELNTLRLRFEHWVWTQFFPPKGSCEHCGRPADHDPVECWKDNL